MPKIVVFLQFKLKKTEKSLQKYNRLEAELKNATILRRSGPGPCLGRTRSAERNVADQLLRGFTKLYRKRKQS